MDHQMLRVDIARSWCCSFTFCKTIILFLNLYYYTKFHDPKLGGATAVPSSQVYSDIMFLWVIGN